MKDNLKQKSGDKPMPKDVVFVINPGSTSTKIGLFGREGAIRVQNIDHAGTPLSKMASISEQLPIRQEVVAKTLKSWLIDENLVAVVGRGGLLKPLRGGIYRVNQAMIEDTLKCKYGFHASNLGASLAEGIARQYDVPAFIVDPVTVDEFIPEARISGIPEIKRRSRLHALNIKACVRKAAAKLGKEPVALNFVVAHLGGGITVAAVQGGNIIDCNDALLGMGPFSPERAGALPVEGLLRLAYSGEYTFQDLCTKLSKRGGLMAYLGTNDVCEVLKRIAQGDAEADLIFRAMIYQIGKEIGAMATVLQGKVDRIVITGGMAHSSQVVEALIARVGFIAPAEVFPGENELESMAEGGFRAIDGLEEIKTYSKE